MEVHNVSKGNSKKTILVALAGNPNCGKSTLFNALTGARQHVSNYPGITVEKKEGIAEYDHIKVKIVDLPGTYSLTAYSIEELVARNFIVDEKPDCVINIVDATNLDRHLYLTIQLMELGVPVVLALNMMDLAQKHGLEIDVEKLSKSLGIPVVPTVARTGQGTKELLKTVVGLPSRIQKSPLSGSFFSYGPDIDPVLDQMEEEITKNNFMTEKYPARWVALKYLEEDRQIIEKGDEINPQLSEKLKGYAKILEEHLAKTLDTYPEAIIADYRYGYISALLKHGILQSPAKIGSKEITDIIDKIVTNRFLGPMIMIFVLYLVYEFTFRYSEKPVQWFEIFFSYLAQIAESSLPPGLFRSLIVNGIIDGVGAVLGFVPIIVFMFLAIAFLEDTGYLARVSYMMDRIFRTFGLHGNSVMAFIISGGIAGGCAVPGVMATRTLRSSKERLATILTAPFMNCGAKLPVYAVIIAAFFPAHQARVMLVLTLIAWFVALGMAWILRSTILKGPPTPFLLELPTYRLPTFKGLMIHTWERTWQYIKKAGTIILAISVLLWALMTFPGMSPEQKKVFNQKKREIMNSGAPRENIERELERMKVEEQQAIFMNSVAARIGKAMTTFTRWCGFDWRTNVAIFGGFAAKEVIISTMGTAYSLGDVTEENIPLSLRLRQDPSWNAVKAWAFLLFVMLYSPCIATVACIIKETGGFRWGAFAIVMNTMVAWVVSVVVYQGAKLLGIM